MTVTEAFDLSTDDLRAIQLAKATAQSILQHEDITLEQVAGLSNALYALERLPLPTPGAMSEFGFVYRRAGEGTNEVHFISFRITGSKFAISRGGFIYDQDTPGEAITVPGWLVDLSGERETGCDLDALETLVGQCLDEGADIMVGDNSDLEWTESS